MSAGEFCAEAAGEIEEGCVTAHLYLGERNYCGCCGREMGYLWSQFHDFCVKCDPHVLKTGQLPDRTYYAQTGKECPYQMGGCLDYVKEVLDV